MFPELWVHVGGGIDTQPHDGQAGWSSDPADVLAWALRYAGRERVVPIIEQALVTTNFIWRKQQAEAVFDALNEEDAGMILAACWGRAGAAAGPTADEGRDRGSQPPVPRPQLWGVCMDARRLVR